MECDGNECKVIEKQETASDPEKEVPEKDMAQEPEQKEINGNKGDIEEP